MLAGGGQLLTRLKLDDVGPLLGACPVAPRPVQPVEQEAGPGREAVVCWGARPKEIDKHARYWMQTD